jgi:hypothetical protein
MATRFYVVPKAGTGVPADNDPFRPQYFLDTLGTGLIAGSVFGMDYGLEPYFLVAAEVTPAEHAAIAAHADVIALPANLDTAIGANLGTVTGKLETIGFPSDWVDAGTTYRQVVRTMTKYLQFAQRLHGSEHVRLLPAGITLNSLVSDLTAAQRQRLANVIASFGGTASAITGAMTMRAAIRNLAEQLPAVASMLDTTL